MAPQSRSFGDVGFCSYHSRKQKMTGFELVSKFYLVNLNYLEYHPSVDDMDHISLALFLLGLIETACIVCNPISIHPDVVEFMNDN